MKSKITKKIGKFEKVNSCILCKNKGYHHFISVPDRNYITGNFTYVQCNKCDLIWLNPRPTLRALGNYYPTSYPAHKNLKPLSTAQKIIRKIIRNNIFIAHLFIKEKLYYWKPKGRILDVGTGNGTYLRILKEWGWDAYGIEFNGEAVRRARQFGISQIQQGTIHSAKFNSGYFDVIRYSHVLEHVPSPTQDLKAAYKLLRKGGSLIITVPNINSLFFKIFKSYWYPLEPPRHLYQFSDKTLSRLLRWHGFRSITIKYIQSPNPLLWSIKYALGMNNIEKKMKYTGFLFGLLLLPLTWLHKSDIIEISAQR